MLTIRWACRGAQRKTPPVAEGCSMSLPRAVNFDRVDADQHWDRLESRRCPLALVRQVTESHAPNAASIATVGKSKSFVIFASEFLMLFRYFFSVYFLAFGLSLLYNHLYNVCAIYPYSPNYWFRLGTAKFIFIRSKIYIWILLHILHVESKYKEFL